MTYNSLHKKNCECLLIRIIEINVTELIEMIFTLQLHKSKTLYSDWEGRTNRTKAISQLTYYIHCISQYNHRSDEIDRSGKLLVLGVSSHGFTARQPYTFQEVHLTVVLDHSLQLTTTMNSYLHLG